MITGAKKSSTGYRLKTRNSQVFGDYNNDKRVAAYYLTFQHFLADSARWTTAVFGDRRDKEVKGIASSPNRRPLRLETVVFGGRGLVSLLQIILPCVIANMTTTLQCRD